MNFKVLHTEWSDGLGGQEMRILLEAKALAGLGHQVTVLTRPGCRIADKAREEGLRVIETPMRQSYDLPALFRLIMLFRREKFDVINTHSSVDSWLASAAAKLTRTPVLVRTRHLSVPVSTHFLNFVYRWPDGIVVTAEATRQRLIAVNRLDPDRIATIPTGVDLKRFNPNLDPGDIRARLGLAPGLRVVTMVAVLRSWKRHEVFLEAAAELAANRPELRFLVVGEGPRRPNIEEKIRELNLGQKVILTGHRLDIPEILAISDVAVLTSESSEGVPQSVLQYQAMAKPVTATRAGGIPEVVEDGRTGLLCPVNDPQALAQALARLLDDKILALEMGRQARQRIEDQHSLEAMAQATLDFYTRLYRTKTGRKA